MATTFDGARANRPARAWATAALCALLCAAPALDGAFAQASRPTRAGALARKNGHGAPFFALTAAAGASCPTPLGPRPARAQPGDEAHGRAGRGAGCRLAPRCAKPDSSPHDADIAAAVRNRLHDAPALAGTRIWITVQRRFVYADGCVPAGFDRLALQKQLESVDDVERVFVRVTSDPRAMLPYPSAAKPR